ncbi:hypothetical protein GOODEAATRI_013446, partial [Goodea atripinnis]
ETSPIAQPQAPTQNQNQLQFQHIKASKSMDLGTAQNQHHIGGEEFCIAFLLCMLAACISSLFGRLPADAWLHKPHAD